MGARQAVPASMDTVRGLACLMIVALHVVGDTGNNGLHLPMTSDWHYAMKSIEFLRIPLFTALSGYLYAGSRVTTGTFLIFWRKKIRRLGVPLVFVFIATAMAIVVVTIGTFGPRTRGLALEDLAH